MTTFTIIYIIQIINYLVLETYKYYNNYYQDIHVNINVNNTVYIWNILESHCIIIPLQYRCNCRTTT